MRISVVDKRENNIVSKGVVLEYDAGNPDECMEATKKAALYIAKLFSSVGENQTDGCARSAGERSEDFGCYPEILAHIMNILARSAEQIIQKNEHEKK